MSQSPDKHGPNRKHAKCPRITADDSGARGRHLKGSPTKALRVDDDKAVPVVQRLWNDGQPDSSRLDRTVQPPRGGRRQVNLQTRVPGCLAHRNRCCAHTKISACLRGYPRVGRWVCLGAVAGPGLDVRADGGVAGQHRRQDLHQHAQAIPLGRGAQVYAMSLCAHCQGGVLWTRRSRAVP